MKELVLTGIRDFWPQDESNAIFLGPWCFAGNHKYKFWDQENFMLAPSPWKSPQDILDAALYIDSLIDRIIPLLLEIMNNFHGVKYHERFWKIYTIIWLIHWLGHCYDRYKRLEQAEKVADEKLTVKIIKENPYRARDFWGYWGYMKGITEGHYHNLLLMSDIIRNGQFDNLVPEALDISNITNNTESVQQEKHGYYFKDKAKNLSISIKNLIKAKIENYVSSSVHLGTVYGISILDKFYLQFYHDPFFLFKRKDTDKLIAIEGRREQFFEQSIKFNAKNEFERVVEKILLQYIPDALLTLYIRKRNDKPKTKVWIGNDIWKSEENAFRIAEMCEYGGQWISSQHGGGYGQTLSFPIGKIEYETSDGFITWGWDFKHIYLSHYYPLPSPMLSRLPKHKQKKDQIVFVSTQHPSYFYRLHSTLLPEQQLAYLVNKKHFFSKLERDILLKVKYRPYFYNYGIDDPGFLSKVLSPDHFLLKGKLTDVFKSSRLVVIDHMSTSFVEAFVMNAPTILFWNPKHFAVCNEAAPYFDKLRSSGILFDTPDAAAEKVNKIWDNVQGWWQQPGVQKAKDEFCYQFARTSKNWRKEWAAFLKGLKD